jgi:hypothetical protein
MIFIYRRTKRARASQANTTAAVAAPRQSMSLISPYPISLFNHTSYQSPPRSGPGAGVDTSGLNYCLPPDPAAATNIHRHGPATSFSHAQPQSSKARAAITLRVGRSDGVGLATQPEMPRYNALNSGGQSSERADVVGVRIDAEWANGEQQERLTDLPPAYDPTPAPERS